MRLKRHVRICAKQRAVTGQSKKKASVNGSSMRVKCDVCGFEVLRHGLEQHRKKCLAKHKKEVRSWACYRVHAKNKTFAGRTMPVSAWHA